MDAKHLAQIDLQKASQTQGRTTLSNKHSELGFACLTQALEAPAPAAQKPFLLQACDAFSEGIRFQRTNPEPYVGFAYVLLLIGNTDKAIGYIQEAQRLEPDHADIGLLLLEWKRQTSPKPAAGKATSNQPPAARPVSAPAGPAMAAIDYDALYDKLELQIMSEVRALMNAPLVEAKPSIEVGHISELEQQIKAIQKQLASFERQLKVIDEEIDIVELSLKLKPIEVMLRRYQKARQVSGILTSLCQDITEQYRLAHQMLQESRLSTDAEDVPIAEENLEVLLDRIDSFANCLDELEAQGHDIEAALQRYNRLLAVLEDLQETLDDLKSQFATP